CAQPASMRAVQNNAIGAHAFRRDATVGFQQADKRIHIFSTETTVDGQSPETRIAQLDLDFVATIKLRDDADERSINKAQSRLLPRERLANNFRRERLHFHRLWSREALRGNDHPLPHSKLG